MSDEEDIPLVGGLSTPVVLRRGSAVHRSAGPWTPTSHRLLEHLHRCGVAFVPRPLGMDEAGREVLTHLPGEVPTYPMPPWVWSSRVLDTAARQLAQVHAATRSFLAAEVAEGRDSTWQEPVRQPAEVVCLNDVAPYNMVFSAGDVVGWIDVDKASPGPRTADLAHLAYRLVPLASTDITGAGAPELGRYRRRLERLCWVYSASGDGASVSPREVLVAFADLLRRTADDVDRRCASGAEELAGHGDFYRSELAWLARSEAALLAPGAGQPV